MTDQFDAHNVEFGVKVSHNVFTKKILRFLAAKTNVRAANNLIRCFDGKKSSRKLTTEMICRAVFSRIFPKLNFRKNRESSK